VRFLLDHDVPDDIEYSLAALGHEVLKLREVLPRTAGRLSLLPCQSIPARDVPDIELHAVVVRSGDDAHPFGLRIEPRVPQDAADVFRCLSRFEVQPDKAVATVT
jgi:hypothetical protein